ncbi:MAG: phosphoribosyltransferase [Lutibacter sp.]|nr:phosphoribosyltransferase [Lutibacter sp.]
MHNFQIEANEFLKQDIQAYYHTDYVGFRRQGNPDYINYLKNTYNDYTEQNIKNLNVAIQTLTDVLNTDLPQILQVQNISPLIVCVVPRAKTESNYQYNQLLFKAVVRDVVEKIPGFYNGVDYIVRHTNTRTTHLPPNTPNYNNDGENPYPGITIKTCDISSEIKGKNILLIDDLYTKTVNIDEDAIQALLDNGARSVIFYAVGKTVQNRF